MGVSVHDREQTAGSGDRSVTIYVVTHTNKGGGLGSSDYHEFWRLQLSIKYTDAVGGGALAVKCSNAILGGADTLESTYGVLNIQQMADIDIARQNPNVREFYITQDYTFETVLVLPVSES